MSKIHETIISLIKSSTTKKRLTLVDYGCGSGELLSYLDLSKFYAYDGWDVSLNALEKAEIRTKRNVRFHQIKHKGNFSLAEKQSVDVITAIGVLQYMSKREIEWFICESQRVLKKDGILIMSCSTDHFIYKIMDIYKYFLPHNYIQRNWLNGLLEKSEFHILFQKETGLIITPVFSQCITFVFDGIDRYVFGVKGTLGPMGKTARKVFAPILAIESRLPIDYGFTLLTSARN